MKRKPGLKHKFAEALRRLRLSRGMKLTELADHMDVSLGYLSNVENSKASVPSNKVINKIAHILLLGQNEVKELCDAAALDRGGRSTVEIDYATGSNVALHEIITNWPYLSDREQKAISKIVYNHAIRRSKEYLGSQQLLTNNPLTKSKRKKRK